MFLYIIFQNFIKTHYGNGFFFVMNHVLFWYQDSFSNGLLTFDILHFLAFRRGGLLPLDPLREDSDSLLAWGVP